MAKLSQESKVYLVYKVMRDNIADGIWEPGAKFSSFEVARKYGIGRTTVNDAIKILEKKGFIYILPNVGFVVNELTEKEICEYFEVRLALEKILSKYIIECESQDKIQNIYNRLKLIVASFELKQYDTTMQGVEEYHKEISTVLESSYVQNIFKETEDMEYYVLNRIKNHNPKNLGIILSIKLEYIKAMLEKNYTESVEMLIKKNIFMCELVMDIIKEQSDE